MDTSFLVSLPRLSEGLKPPLLGDQGQITVCSSKVLCNVLGVLRAPLSIKVA